MSLFPNVSMRYGGMRILQAVCTSVLLALSSVCVGQSPFSLTITPLKSTVAVGDDVWVRVTITNTSSREIDCTAHFVNGTDRTYQYDVRDPRLASKRKPNMRPEEMPGSIQMCTLEPGKSVTHDTRISWLNDFSQPGNYTIQLSRNLSADDTGGSVKSNKVEVVVTAK
jgi:hypothetical protein